MQKMMSGKFQPFWQFLQSKLAQPTPTSSMKGEQEPSVDDSDLSPFPDDALPAETSPCRSRLFVESESFSAELAQVHRNSFYSNKPSARLLSKYSVGNITGICTIIRPRAHNIDEPEMFEDHSKLNQQSATWSDFSLHDNPALQRPHRPSIGSNPSEVWHAWDGTDEGTNILFRGDSVYEKSAKRSSLTGTSTLLTAAKMREVSHGSSSSLFGSDAKTSPNSSWSSFPYVLSQPVSRRASSRSLMTSQASVQTSTPKRSSIGVASPTMVKIDSIASDFCFQDYPPEELEPAKPASLIYSTALVGGIFGRICSFIGSVAGISMCRNWSLFFYQLFGPGCTYYGEFVRAKMGRLTLSEQAAIWEQLVLCTGLNSRYYNRFIYGGRDWHSLVQDGKAGQYAHAIQQDVARILGWNMDAMAQPSKPGILVNLTREKQLIMEKTLCEVLFAIAGCFGQVGYCQGSCYFVFHMMVTLGLLSFDEPGSFTTTVNSDRLAPEGFRAIYFIFTRCGLADLYSSDLKFIQNMMKVLEILIEKCLPKLNAHFKDIGFDVFHFAIGWFESLFVYVDEMPLQTLTDIWNIWISEQSLDIFVQVAVAILDQCQEDLLKCDFEKSLQYIKQIECPNVLLPQNIIPRAVAVEMKRDLLFL